MLIIARTILLVTTWSAQIHPGHSSKHRLIELQICVEWKRS